ncbi:MAG: NAD(P)H-binding protein [Actinophytocola sp.]|uniref:SDR family oxidoreductase n=1 Tax=Actinophytocola sp. TaxID=1872138 RepID=UPI001324A590|nr:SDR family oxidoreductase [Actinophytocola sp.]MPZ81393.1 NAD(P)H-binding protein [Actinophytocola sp.]
MRVVIAGGHGKIALRMTKLLAGRGDTVVGLVRNPDHVDDVRAAGGDARVLDLESADAGAVGEVVAGADAVVFAAGAGPGSGSARKDTVDRAASVLLADAAESVGVRRYLQISAMGLDRADDPNMDQAFAGYLRAKAAAERDLMARGLEWTVLRPGRLTDDPGTGRVTLADRVPPGAVTRDDVAATCVGLLDTPSTAGRVLELIGGDVPIERALAELA